MPKFVYRGDKRTAESTMRKSKEGTRDYDSFVKPGIPFFKPKEGENCIRILPSTWEEPDWDYPIFLHYNIGPDEGRYLCTAKMKDEPCAACDAKLEAADAEEADQLSPSKGAVCWLVDRDNEKAGPQMWVMPLTKVRNEILTRSIDKKTRAPILIDDPEEGFDVVFTRTGTGQKTNYTGVEVVRDPSPLCENEKTQEKWLAYIAENPLPACLNFYDADYLGKILHGKAVRKPAEDDSEAEAAAPRTSRRRPAAEEEEAPAPRTARRAPPPDEEEEAPAPRSGRRAAAPKEEEEEVPASRTSRRRALLDDAGDEEVDPETGEVAEEPAPRGRRAAAEEETPVATARRSLERLKTPGRGR